MLSVRATKVCFFELTTIVKARICLLQLPALPLVALKVPRECDGQGSCVVKLLSVRAGRR